MKIEGNSIAELESSRISLTSSATAASSYSSGTFAGVRAADHLRMLLGQLGMPAIPAMLPFPVIGDLFDDDLNPGNERIERSASRFIDQFIWYIEAFRNQREKGVPK